MSVKNYEFNFNLMSALFSQEKCLPLLFTNAGIDIELHLESGSRIGATTTYTDSVATSSGAAGNRTYTNPQNTLLSPMSHIRLRTLNTSQILLTLTKSLICG